MASQNGSHHTAAIDVWLRRFYYSVAGLAALVSVLSKWLDWPYFRPSLCLLIVSGLALITGFILNRTAFSQKPRNHLSRFLPGLFVFALGLFLAATLEPLRIACCPPAATPTIPPPTATATPTPTLTPTPPTQVRVAVMLIPDYIYEGEIVPALRDLGYQANYIDLQSDYSAWRDYDVVYLPAGWGYQSAILEDKAASFTAYLEQGGGVFLERPNSKDPFTATFLPYSFTFALTSSPADAYPSSPFASHPITEGVDRGDLPEAGNQVNAYDHACVVLATTDVQHTPTLLACAQPAGRVVVATSTIADTEDIHHPLSPNLVDKALQWLAHRIE